MGSFNRRIGNMPTVITDTNSRVVFKRNSQDGDVSRNAKREGRILVETMNAWDMLIMNGIDSGGEYTYESKNKKGASVIDYIILDKELVEYEHDVDDVEDGLDLNTRQCSLSPSQNFWKV